MIEQTEVDYNGAEFEVLCPSWDNERAKLIPQRTWDTKYKVWRVPAIKVNAAHLLREYSGKEWTIVAKTKALEIKNANNGPKLNFPAWFKFKQEPWEHQSRGLNQTYNQKEVALFMEMRTGKSYVAINYGAAHAMEGHINAMIIFCPTSIKPVWKDEIESKCPIATNVYVLEAGDKGIDRFIQDTETDGMKVLVVGIEALSQGGAYKICERFVSTHNAMCIIDESHTIKTPNSARTKKAWAVGGGCNYRMILTGTPITQGIQDLYAQFRFLDWKILGHKSYFSFRNRYCIMGGFEGRQIVGYRNIEELMDLVRPYVFQVNAVDVIDPPERIYEKRYVKPTKQQKRAMDDLGDPTLMFTKQGDLELEIETTLERMTRYQQIAGGLFPYGLEDGGYDVVPIEGQNPKFNEMVSVIEETRPETKIIIWARFRPEVELIVAHLNEVYGSNTVREYHGGNRDTRGDEYRSFRTDGDARFFVTNQQTGSRGLELAEASMHIFFSNSFSYEEREQAEARTNSKLQIQKNVLYVDIVMDHKIDKMIHKALEFKESLATFVKRKMENQDE